MPRKDYEYLINNFKVNDYDVKSHHKDSSYPCTFAKVSYEKTVLKEKIEA